MTTRFCFYLGSGILLFLIVATLIAPLIAPHHPLRQDLDRDLIVYSADHP
ncbi:MAG: ABC transporter permease, partial [Candidatus Binatia bacterium]